MSYLSLILVLITTINIGLGQRDWTQLEISTGKLQGRKVVGDIKNTTAYVFLDIPFAESTEGELRYKAPVPRNPWKGVRDARYYGPACIQNTSFSGSIQPENMSEDCLHVNVFTTENCLDKGGCPVLYYIHGGVWNFDSPMLFREGFLVDNYQSKDIVLVTVVYRLGAMGFLNTGKSTSAVKNGGMLDIIEGLRWTQREIHNFGGDKTKVTIMGHSSGAEATDLVSLSPKTEGLFRSVVILSGPASMLGGIQNDTNVNQSRALAIKANCATEELWDSGEDFETILACLRSKPARTLTALQVELEHEGVEFAGPTIDERESGILPDDAATLMANRRPYNYLIGTTSKEFQIGRLIAPNGKVIKPLLNVFCQLAAKIGGFKHPQMIGQSCSRDYGRRPEDVADLVDDLAIYVPTYNAGESIRSKGAVVYKYSFEYEHIGAAFFNMSEDVPGPFHAQDLVYIMGLHEGVFTEKDQQIRFIYSGMIADFVAKVDPSPSEDKWEPTDDRNNYYKINFEKEDMKMPGNTNGYHQKAVDFWGKKAVTMDKALSQWDDFNLGDFLQQLSDGLKQTGAEIAAKVKQMLDEWRQGISGKSHDFFQRLQGILNGVFHEQSDLEETYNEEEEAGQCQKKAMADRMVRRMVESIAPSVRADNATAVNGTTETPGGQEEWGWHEWFWVAVGVAGALAVLLLGTCLYMCIQKAKYRHYERLSEQTPLQPSSSKTYT